MSRLSFHFPIFPGWSVVVFLCMNIIMGRRNPSNQVMMMVIAFGNNCSGGSRVGGAFVRSISSSPPSFLTRYNWYRSKATVVPFSLALCFSLDKGENHNDSDDVNGDNDNNNHNEANATEGEPFLGPIMNDESLLLRFQRAVVLQRAGQYNDALREYQTFVKAAESCNVSPEMYAEVHVNMGAIYMKLKDWTKARNNFKRAIDHRRRGKDDDDDDENNVRSAASAHVNLALCLLAERQELSLKGAAGATTGGTSALDRSRDVSALQEARYHCQRAMEEDKVDTNAKNAATRLMRDIQNILKQMGVEEADTFD